MKSPSRLLQHITHIFRLALTICSAVLLSACSWTAPVNVSSTGELGNGDVRDWLGMSSNGRYVVFGANSNNIEPQHTNSVYAIFVRDTLLGTTSLVDLDSTGVRPPGENSFGGAAISDDGRYVAFGSQISLLVDNDGNAYNDIFLRDRVAGVTTRVSVDPAGNDANGVSGSPSISADGQYIAFLSSASNLVENDNNVSADAFVHDRIMGTTVRVSVNSAGVQANRETSSAQISGDGRFVVLATDALLTGNAGDSTGTSKVYVHRLSSGQTSLVSRNQAGVVGDRDSFNPSISRDGRYVSFVSRANNLSLVDTYNTADIYVRDRVANTTSLISVDSDENPSLFQVSAVTPDISDDGRYVAFLSEAADLVAGDSNGRADVFIRDRQLGVTNRASVDLFGAQANQRSLTPHISADGRYVAFATLADNLVPNDTNGRRDIVIRANPQPQVHSIVPDHLPIGATTAVTITGVNFLPGTVLSGTTFSNVVVHNETTITANAVVPNTTATGAGSLTVVLLGTGPGPGKGSYAVCLNCLTFF